ncbi:MAG: glycosyltransferase family 39 protein [Anaerolineae bacterium]
MRQNKLSAENRKGWWGVAGILLLALVARALWAFGWLRDRVVWGDEPFYLWLGHNLMTTGFYSFTGHWDVHHTPLYPVVAGCVSLLTRDLKLASDLCYLLFGSLLVLPIYALGRDLYGRFAGALAAVAAAVFPSLVVGPLQWGTMTEPLFLAVVAGGMCALWAGWCRGWTAGYVLAGFCFGLAYLARPEAIWYPVALGGYLGLVGLLKREWRVAPWGRLLLLGLAFFGTIFPYLAYVRAHTGHWMVSEKVGLAYEHGFALGQRDYAAFDQAAWGLDSSGTEVRFFSPELYTLSLKDQILADLPGFARLLKMNALRFLQTLVAARFFPGFLWPLLLLGFFRRPWDRRRLEGEAYLWVSTVPVGSFVLFQVLDRYMAPLLIPLVLWLGKGLAEWADWAAETLGNLSSREIAGVRRFLLRGGLAALLAGSFLGLQPLVRQALDVPASFRAEHRTVGEWLGEHTEPDAVVMSRYPALAFHADRRWVATANAPLPDLERYALVHGVDYLVVDARELPLRPQFAPLVAGEGVPPWLELLAVQGEGEERMAIYRLRGGPGGG